MAARAALAGAARRAAASLGGSAVPSPMNNASKMIPRRGLAGGGDHHGPPKVNCWEDPLSPSKWKEEHGVPQPAH